MNKQFAKRVKDLAAIIMDSDLPKQLMAENEFLRRTRTQELSTRWIMDERNHELYERQPDNSYKPAYRVTPLTDAA